MRQKSTWYLKVLGANSGQSGHVFVAAHGHLDDPQVGGCRAPFAVVEEPNRPLGPTPTGTRIGIPAHNKRAGPVPINGVH